jgi:hypothetical protein
LKCDYREDRLRLVFCPVVVNITASGLSIQAGVAAALRQENQQIVQFRPAGDVFPGGFSSGWRFCSA